MVNISLNKTVIGASLLLIILFLSFGFYMKQEDVKVNSTTIKHLVYADCNTVENVEAEVVFSLSEPTVNIDLHLDNLETTVQTAISDASNKYIDEQQQKLEEEIKRQLEIEAQKKAANLSYNPFVKSNLTVEQYNKILKGTGLEGCGNSFYNMEQTYGVNGLFAIGVAFHESAYGKARANTNNFYGMRGNNGWMAFESPDANIQYFGKLMNKSLYYGKSIVNIGKVYCPGTYEHWANAVKSMMSTSFSKIY